MLPERWAVGISAGLFKCGTSLSATWDHLTVGGRLLDISLLGIQSIWEGQKDHFAFRVLLRPLGKNSSFPAFLRHPFNEDV